MQKPPFVGMIMTYQEIKSQLESFITLTEDSLILCLQALNIKNQIGLKFKQIATSSQIYLVKIPGKLILFQLLKYILMKVMVLLSF